MTEEFYVSVDIEADGPIPAQNSMLSLGAVAFTEDGKETGEFSANLQELPGAMQDPDTMNWWAKHPGEWDACRLLPQDPEFVMMKFVKWVEGFSGKPALVAYPAGYDFMFVYWYMMRFAKRSPFSFSAIDIKSFAMALLKKPYRQCSKRNMPKNWFDENVQHSHVAVQDAREQGRLFLNMLRHSKSK